MGFTEILTILFIVLKVFNLIDWSWWLVFMPEIIALALYLIIFIGSLVGINKTSRKFDKHFKF